MDSDKLQLHRVAMALHQNVQFANFVISVIVATCASGASSQAGAEPNNQVVRRRASISASQRDKSGFLVHKVESPCQAETTFIRVLLPDEMGDDTRYPVVYVLPVEAADGIQYGSGLREVKTHDLHNRHRAIFVAPTFAALPWYADHASKDDSRQETYLVREVVPFIDEHYPVIQKRDGRLLLGFSKSGWGAWTLLLRNSDVFGRAAAWDAPLMMQQVGKYGNGPIFGTQENFERYRLTDLLSASAKALRGDKANGAPRLILAGYGNFRKHHLQAHSLLDELRVPHVYQDGPKRKHDWHSGWVAEAVAHLLANRQQDPHRKAGNRPSIERNENPMPRK